MNATLALPNTVVRSNPPKETFMTITPSNETRDVDHAVDYYTTLIAGIELLGKIKIASDAEFHMLRLSLTKAIVRAGNEMGGPDLEADVYTDEVKAAAIEVLAETERDDLENLLRDWIIRTTQIDVIKSHSAGRRDRDCIEAVELMLPECGYDVVAVLVLRDGDRPNQLFVTQGVETVSRIVLCPGLMEEAFVVAEED
jgi:hypothetical protein